MKKDRVKAVRTEGLIILPGGNIAGSAMGTIKRKACMDSQSNKLDRT